MCPWVLMCIYGYHWICYVLVQIQCHRVKVCHFNQFLLIETPIFCWIFKNILHTDWLFCQMKQFLSYLSQSGLKLHTCLQWYDVLMPCHCKGVCINQSKFNLRKKITELWMIHTVFPQIVSTETILFWICKL